MGLKLGQTLNSTFSSARPVPIEAMAMLDYTKYALFNESYSCNSKRK